MAECPQCGGRTTYCGCRVSGGSTSREVIVARSPDIEEVVQAAIEAGYTVYRSTPDILLLDLDSPTAEKIYLDHMPIVQVMYGAMEIERWKSKGGENLHVVVKLNVELEIVTRLALQTMLGSDPLKELLSLKRVKEGQNEPCLLFKPAPKEVIEVVTAEFAPKGILFVWDHKGITGLTEERQASESAKCVETTKAATNSG